MGGKSGVDFDPQGSLPGRGVVFRTNLVRFQGAFL